MAEQTRQDGWVYTDPNDNLLQVYRASSIGSCTRSLVAARLGESAAGPNAGLRAAMEASSGLEDECIRRFCIEMASSDVIWQQKTVELPVDFDVNKPRNGWPAVIRGHLDGLFQLDDSVIEVKALGPDNFAKYNSGGLDALGFLGRKYKWQMAVYGHATERKVRLVIGQKEKVDFSGEPGSKESTWAIGELIIEPAVDPESLVPLTDIFDKVQMIEGFAAHDELPPCDGGCREGDAYSEAHIFKSPDVADSVLDELVRLYADLKSEEDDIKERKDVIRERIITEYGVGKYTAGPFTCRVEHVKPTQRVDSKKLKKMFPEIYEECSTFGQQTIRLTVTGGKRDAD